MGDVSAMGSPDHFADLVTEALASLPKSVSQHMRNVSIVIADWPDPDVLEQLQVPDDQTILGLYQGLPITERNDNEALLPPDVITVFRGPLEQLANGDADILAGEVRQTVLHEIAHHFGIDDDRLHELGAY